MTPSECTYQIIQKLEALETINQNLDYKNQLYLHTDVKDFSDEYMKDVKQLLAARQNMINSITEIVFIQQMGRRQ